LQIYGAYAQLPEHEVRALSIAKGALKLMVGSMYVDRMLGVSPTSRKSAG